MNPSQSSQRNMLVKNGRARAQQHFRTARRLRRRRTAQQPGDLAWLLPLIGGLAAGSLLILVWREVGKPQSATAKAIQPRLAFSSLPSPSAAPAPTSEARPAASRAQMLLDRATSLHQSAFVKARTERASSRQVRALLEQALALASEAQSLVGDMTAAPLQAKAARPVARAIRHAIQQLRNDILKIMPSH